MRTVYQVWSKAEPHAQYEAGVRADSWPEARDSLGLPADTQWRLLDSGRYVPEGGWGQSHVAFFIAIEMEPETPSEQIGLALELISKYKDVDGAHHKTWLLDQVTRMLAGGDYETFVAEYRNGEDGPETYEWDEGIAP